MIQNDIMISLIIPTLNRILEVKNLLESISDSKYRNYEVILVDQNQDNRLDSIVKYYSQKMKIKHEKVNFKGAARARNYGARLAIGTLINFPDDDSVIDNITLDFVANHIEWNKQDAAFGKIVDPLSKQAILHFKKGSCKVKKTNIYQTCMECNMFIKKMDFDILGGFDERLGVGEYFGAEEGADFFLKLLSKGKKLYFYDKTFFYHSNKKNYNNIERALTYGRGFGGFVRKHWKEYRDIMPTVYMLYFNTKALVAVFLFWVKRDMPRVKFNWIVFKARIQGYKEWKKIYG